MHLTLWLDPRRTWADLLVLALQAEQAGWDAVRYGGAVGGECWPVMGALAASVPRLRLEVVLPDDVGTHPAVVAKLAVTVDQLSGGRLLLGLAPGAGADGEARLAEGCDVVKCLASGGPATLRGEFYRLEDAPLDPKAVQQPFPLMVVGGTPDLAARSADHWSISGSPEEVRAQLVALDHACRHLNRARGEIAVSAWADGNGSLPDDASAGVDGWVVPDVALGPDRLEWRQSLARIRHATQATNQRR